MRLKNKLLLILAFLLTTVSGWGAKAISTPIPVLQTDGTQLTIFLHGDEHFNWVTTLPPSQRMEPWRPPHSLPTRQAHAKAQSKN